MVQIQAQPCKVHTGGVLRCSRMYILFNAMTFQGKKRSPWVGDCVLYSQLYAGHSDHTNPFCIYFSDLRVSIDAPEQEGTLHTAIGKSAKGLKGLSGNVIR